MVICCFPGEIKAQPTPEGPGEFTTGGPGGPGGGGFDPTPVPIDGGAGWLLAAGAGYGIKKLRERRKKNRETQEDSEPQLS